MLGVFIEIFTNEQESDLIIKNIENTMIDFALFKEHNLKYIINYFMEHYDLYDNRQKKLTHYLLLNYERNFNRKNPEHKTDVI